MDCNISKYWIDLYINNEIDDDNKLKLLEHLEICETCEAYLNGSLKLDASINEIFKDKKYDEEKIIANIMGKIKREKFWRLKKISISAAIIMIVFFITPINGKTAAAHISDWVRNLKIVKPELTIKIEEREKDLIIRNDDNLKDIYNNFKIFTSEADFKKRIQSTVKHPCISEYIPDGYKFEKAYYGEGNSYKFRTCSYYKRKWDNKDSDYLEIAINYHSNNSYISESTEFLNTNEKVKELKINEEQAYLKKTALNSKKNELMLKILPYIKPVDIEILYTGAGDDDMIEKELLQVGQVLVRDVANTR